MSDRTKKAAARLNRRMAKHSGGQSPVRGSIFLTLLPILLGLLKDCPTKAQNPPTADESTDEWKAWKSKTIAVEAWNENKQSYKAATVKGIARQCRKDARNKDEGKLDKEESESMALTYLDDARLSTEQELVEDIRAAREEGGA